ncbi:Ku protein [Saccharopolyspora sp. 5N102]|uniref:Ku protein n=1 Tax=Saccharopolyspora sp. 5N102 TaxID=3375155 RepID=UPI0037ABFB73
MTCENDQFLQITFGLVTIPCTLHLATRDRRVSFHQIHTCGGRIRYRKFCERESREVPLSEIASAYDYGPPRPDRRRGLQQPSTDQRPPTRGPTVRFGQGRRAPWPRAAPTTSTVVAVIDGRNAEVLGSTTPKGGAERCPCGASVGAGA